MEKNRQNSDIAKISRPDAAQILPRKRLFPQLQEPGKFPLTWVSGPPGSGKTSCVSSFIAAQDVPCLWYRIDSNDIHPATFFKYLAISCQQATEKKCELPAYKGGTGFNTLEFSRDFFSEL